MVKVAVPAVVGVPLSTPAVESESPAGNAPAETLQVMGCVPWAVKVRV